MGIGSLPNDELPLCSKQVWYYQNGRYVTLTNSVIQRGEEADLYIPLKFEGLKPEDIQYLSAAGVKRVTLYSILNGSPNQQSLSIKRSYLIPLEESAEDKYGSYMLPVQEGFPSENKTAFKQEDSNKNSNEDSNKDSNKDSNEDHNISKVQSYDNYKFSSSGLVALIFLIIIIIIILWAYQVHNIKDLGPKA